MPRTRLFLLVLPLLALAAGLAQSQDSKDKSKAASADTASAPIPQQDADKPNPVKPTANGLAEARKLFGYHCAMCHGQDGAGKGDLAEQMKLQLNDWRDPATLSKYTDGALFYIVTNGRGKMIGGEGDRTKEEIRWNLVNLVRSFGKKPEEATKQQ
jgi:mono/diheme cytochrome c family protein